MWRGRSAFNTTKQTKPCVLFACITILSYGCQQTAVQLLTVLDNEGGHDRVKNGRRNSTHATFDVHTQLLARSHQTSQFAKRCKLVWQGANGNCALNVLVHLYACILCMFIHTEAGITHTQHTQTHTHKLTHTQTYTHTHTHIQRLASQEATALLDR